MNPRLATLAELCRETVLPASVLACLAFGAADAEYTKAASKAAPVVNRIAPALAADARAVHQAQAQPVTSNYAALANTALGNTALGNSAPPAADVATANAEVAPASRNAVTSSAAVAEAGLQPTTEAAPQAAPTEHQQTPPAPETDKPIVTASLSDPTDVLPPATPLAQVATEAVPSGATASDTGDAKQDGKPPADTVAVLDECYVVDTCVDRYLWTLYQRTPKEDSAKTEERKQVTVKRKGKLVTVTRTISSVVAEDFAWKDPKAAEHAGMSMMDYVIGGVDHDFKMRLFRMLHAAEEAGLQPGITSAFRDDYRQSIASGLKAANDRSYHGGSFRGGYGHGLAADVVSVNGGNRAQRQASTEIFWKWIDTHGGEYGIGRPYLDRDPPHVAPIDGQEYASHNPKARQAAARTHRAVATGGEHGTSKRGKLAARSS
jgi:hypothetical protein